MAFVVAASLILINERSRQEIIKRKRLRDSSNPLDLPDNCFSEYFRVNKESFHWILNKIGENFQNSKTPLPIQLAASLRFFAEGSFQRSVGNDTIVSMHRTTFCKCFSKMLVLLERKLCKKWIKLQMDREGVQKSKRHFSDKFGIPGVIGCIDGTHVELIKPGEQDHLYYNRKGYYSINAMIICDYNMKIMGIDATRPGASHDSFIWNLSLHRDFYQMDNEAFGFLVVLGMDLNQFC